MERAAEILRLAFLAKGCLISKPIFNIVYPKNNLFSRENEIDFANFKYNKFLKPKIIIHLFYYIKTTAFKESNLNNKNTNIISDNFSYKFSNLTDWRALSRPRRASPSRATAGA